jgi:hypothetical protein
VTDAEYAEWVRSLPAWHRNILIATAVAPFAFMLVMIVLGLTGVIR